MNLRTSLLVLAVLLLSGPLHAQDKSKKKTLIYQPGAKVPEGTGAQGAPLPTEKPLVDPTAGDAPDKFASSFFGLLQKGEVDRAYEMLTKGSKIAERPDELKSLKAKTREAIDVFGAVLAFEMVESKNVGVRLLRRTYLSVGKEFPLRWRFYFYKPDMAWRLIDLRVDDRLPGMFDEPDEPRSPEKP